MILSLVACGGEKKEENEKKEADEIVGGIKLTTANFEEYIFVYADYARGESGSRLYGRCYTGTINFKATPCFTFDSDMTGTFHNVKVVVRPRDSRWRDEWHIKGDAKSRLEISFELDGNGEFSQEYEIEDTYNGVYCPVKYTEDIVTTSIYFDVVSVSGTFVPDDVSATASSSAG